MATTSATQTGPVFLLEWTLDVDEDVEVRRTSDDPDLFLATVESGIDRYIDYLDTADVGDVLTWTLTGVTSATVTTITHTITDVTIPPLDDDRRYQAVLLVAARLAKRQDAPLGVAGGGEFGPVPVRRRDPDVEELLVGLRRTDTDLSSQTWPALAAVRTYSGIGTDTMDDTALQYVLDSAIEIVTRRCQGAGIA